MNEMNLGAGVSGYLQSLEVICDGFVYDIVLQLNKNHLHPFGKLRQEEPFKQVLVNGPLTTDLLHDQKHFCY